MAKEKVDWKAFAKEIKEDVLDILGTDITIVVTETSARTPSGKKVPDKVAEYKGLGVMGLYDDDFKSKDSSIIKAGDVAFTCQFEDKTFEPTEKKNEKIIFAGKTYTIINVEEINPAGENIIWTIYGRKVL